MEPAYFYKAIAEEVHDGDTYRLRVDLGFRVFMVINARLHGVDAPELRTKEGISSRDYVKLILTPSDGPTPLVVQSFKDEQSFARWVTNIWLPGDVNLAGHLIETGYAVPLNVH